MSGTGQTIVTAAPEDAIVHEFDEMGRIVGGGERRLATLVGKVLAALHRLAPHADVHEIHTAVDDVAVQHEAEANDPAPAGSHQLPAPPIGGLRGVDDTGHYSVGNARAETPVPPVHPGPARPGDPGWVPELGAQGTVETVHYTDGTSATGTAPLPRMSPGQQAFEAKRAEAARQFEENRLNTDVANQPSIANARAEPAAPGLPPQPERPGGPFDHDALSPVEPIQHPDVPLPVMSPGEQRAAEVMTPVSQEATEEARNEARVRQIEEDERARQRGDNVTDPGNTTIGGGAIVF